MINILVLFVDIGAEVRFGNDFVVVVRITKMLAIHEMDSSAEIQIVFGKNRRGFISAGGEADLVEEGTIHDCSDEAFTLFKIHVVIRNEGLVIENRRGG